MHAYNYMLYKSTCKIQGNASQLTRLSKQVDRLNYSLNQESDAFMSLETSTKHIHVQPLHYIGNKAAHAYNGNYKVDEMPLCGICNTVIRNMDQALHCDTCDTSTHARQLCQC